MLLRGREDFGVKIDGERARGRAPEDRHETHASLPVDHGAYMRRQIDHHPVNAGNAARSRDGDIL